MSDIIEISRLSKRFGDVQAVNDLNFRVKEGELFAFLGWLAYVGWYLTAGDVAALLLDVALLVLIAGIVIAVGLYVGMNLLSGRKRH